MSAVKLVCFVACALASCLLLGACGATEGRLVQRDAGGSTVDAAAACSECFNGKCANEIQACNADAACVQMWNCWLGCAAGDTACTGQCGQNNPNFVATAQCLTTQCKTECQ
jgi:hypothetical protein